MSELTVDIGEFQVEVDLLDISKPTWGYSGGDPGGVEWDFISAFHEDTETEFDTLKEVAQAMGRNASSLESELSGKIVEIAGEMDYS